MVALSPRERVMRSIGHQEPDRVPLDLGGSVSSAISIGACNSLKKHLGLHTETRVLEVTFQMAHMEEPLAQALDIDTRPLYGNPPATGNHFNERGDYVDEWGITHTRPEGAHYYTNANPPLWNATIGDLESYPWPDPNDPARVHGLRQSAEELFASDYALVGAPDGFTRIFEQAWQLRGMDQLLVDMIVDLGFVHALFRKITDIQKARWDAYLREAGRYVQVVRVGDDIAMQSGPIMAPGLYRKMLKPYHKEYFAFIKERTDAGLLYHCCGGVWDLLEDFIEIGVDILNPVQVSADGMDTARLKEQFGKRIAFWGAVDTQRVLPQGTPEEVRLEVRKRITDLGSGGGYVLCPVHNLQPDVPPENVLAMYDEARRFGRYPL